MEELLAHHEVIPKVFPMVGGEQDDRVIDFARLGEGFENTAHRVVDEC